MNLIKQILMHILLFSSVTFAANYYVDIKAGNDNNNGTINTPWKYCPGMVGYTGTGTLVAGDVVYFDRGDTWTLTINSNYLLNMVGGVTYNGSTWGTGTRAKFTVTGSVIVNDNIVSMNADHATYETVLTGFELDGNDHSISGGCLIGNNTLTKPVNQTGAIKRIENCVVHNIGLGTPGTEYVYAIGVRSKSGVTVSNVEILNNTCYNTDSDVIMLYPTNEANTAKCSNILVRGNNSYGGGRYGTDVGACIVIKNDVDNVIIESNYCHDSNQGITMSTKDATFNAPRNITIRYNTITGITQYHGIVVQSPFAGNRSFTAYYNLIFNNFQYGICIENDVVGTTAIFNIFNNTLFSNLSSHDVLFKAATITNYTLVFKNNIIYSVSGSLPFSDASGQVTSHSNNIYYRSGGGNLILTNGSYKTFANLSGYETSGICADPLFISPSNFNLNSGSPAIHTGTNVGLTRDFRGAAIIGLPDIGAYEYTGAITTTLPVQVTSFTGAVQGNTVALDWKTATEVNSYSFEIERRTTAQIQWESIGKMPAGGISNAPLEYMYIDSLNNFGSGSIFYRLKSVANDGSFQYSGEVEVLVTTAVTTTALPNIYALSQNYPNPFNPTTTINYQLQKAGSVSLKVYDMLGREVASLVDGNKGPGFYSAVFDASRLSSGTYIYRLQSDSFTEVKKLVLLK